MPPPLEEHDEDGSIDEPPASDPAPSSSLHDFPTFPPPPPTGTPPLPAPMMASG